MRKMDIEYIHGKLTLYRNDTDKPPEVWSKQFKNKHLTYDKVGHKNKAGFFFLTDSIDQAKYMWHMDRTKGYYLTECYAEDIQIIDFSLCITNFQMVYLLYQNGFNILESNFMTYEEKEGDHLKSFKNYKEGFDFVIRHNRDDLAQRKEASHYINQIDALFNRDMGIMGQRLTDLDNGFHFHDLIKTWDPPIPSKIDGYRWRECGDQRGFTYCIFESDKLSNPITQFIDLNTHKDS